MGYNDRCGVDVLKGKTLTKIDNLDDELIFHVDDGSVYKMFHEQDWCEHVTIEDIIGNLSDLVGSPIEMAEEVNGEEKNTDDESYTWTFYKFATIKGYVTIRWYGSSNGYYSESVNFEEVENETCLIWR